MQQQLEGTRDDYLQSLVPTIQQQLEQGEGRERELNEELVTLRAENQRLRVILRAIDPGLVQMRVESPAAPPPSRERHTARRRETRNTGLSHVGIKRRNGTATGYGVTMEAALPFADACKRMQDQYGYVTQKPIYTALGKEQGTCSSAFQWFLSIGFLRRAGSIDRRDKYMILNPEAPYEAVRMASE